MVGKLCKRYKKNIGFLTQKKKIIFFLYIIITKNKSGKYLPRLCEFLWSFTAFFSVTMKHDRRKVMGVSEEKI